MKRSLSAPRSSQPKSFKKARKNPLKAATTFSAFNPKTPFPRLKKCVLMYENGLTQTPSASQTVMHHASNDMFDFDRTLTNNYGNKQPLYYDQLLSANGPYKEFYVPRWETTYTIINNTNEDVIVYVLPPHLNTTELDVKGEAENYPGVVRRYMTPKGGSKDHLVVTVKGNVNDCLGSALKDSDLQGNYALSPIVPVYGGVMLATAGGITALSCSIAVSHKFFCELQYSDAVIS